MPRRAVTLIEMLLTLILMGVLAALAAGPFLALRDSVAVRTEARQLVEAIDMARGAAVRLGVGTQLFISDTSYSVSATALTGEVMVVWRRRGALSRGVQLTGGGAAMQFGPGGIAMGVSNRTLILTRGQITRSVIISRLGRITS
jgi:prepilin-type N-terminal cleavage/methylation domain-containing protein